MNVFARTSPSLILSRSTDTHGHVQNPTRPSRTLCLSRARSLFGTLGLYTSSYPIVVFPQTLPVSFERSKPA